MELEHPSAEHLAAYLDGSLPDDERVAFTAHLAHCRSCRHEVVATGDLITARTRRRRALWLGNALAAAALLAVLLLGPWQSASMPGTDRVRAGAGQADSAAVIRAAAPADGDTVTARNLVFTWQAWRDDPLYRLSLTDGAGREVWTHDTRDTVAALPPEIVLQPGLRYHWYVDALDATGRVVSTGLRRFVASP